MTFRAVADEAGVNNTLIAHHFGTRDQLLAAALEWSLSRSLEAADLNEYSNDSQAFRQALVDNVLTDPGIEIFQYEMILEATRRVELQPSVQKMYRRYLAALLPGLSPGGIVPSEALGRALFAMLDGLMLQYFSHSITEDELIEALEALEAALSPASSTPA